MKREVFYLKEEKKDWLLYKEELEKQVSQLLIVADKPRTEKQTTLENFYTKKLVEKEQIIKDLEEEIFNLKNFKLQKVEKE